MLRKKSKNTNVTKKPVEDVVYINKVTVDKYRKIGSMRIRLVSYDKGPWKISISDAEKPYSLVSMTKIEFKDLLLEIKDMMGDL